MASRSRLFIRSLLAGYGSVAVNILFTLLSIPLAFRYLSKEEFGLWALALQVNGYLGLIDLGMSGAVGRFLADFKDDVNGGSYGSHLVTGVFVFAAQGLIVIFLGLLMVYCIPNLFSIRAGLQHQFSNLLLVLCLISAISIFIRSLASPLWAFQRMDVVNGCASGGLLLQLLVLWLAFRQGMGVNSLVISASAPTLLSLGVYGWVCHANHYFPRRGNWGRPQWALFKKMLSFGKDILLVSLGSQLLNATQVIIISRTLGLDAAANYSIGTKLFAMGQQLYHKVIESSGPGLTEIFVQGRIPRFIERFWDSVALTLVAAIFAAVGIAAGNNSFVQIWTHGAVSWTLVSDLLLALLLLLTSVTRNYVGLFGILKDFRKVRVLYFAEGLVFVPLAVIGAKSFGIVGVIAASLGAHVCVTAPFSFKATVRIVGSSKPLHKGFIASVSLILASSLMAKGEAMLGIPALPSLALAAIPLAVSAWIVWFWILPDHMRVRFHNPMTAAYRMFRRAE